MASAIFSPGQVLKGKLGLYTIQRQLDRCIFLAANPAFENTIIKTAQGHRRAQNERDVLQRFQSHRVPLRPLLDEIHEPAQPLAIVLKYLDSDLLRESAKKLLSRKEIKQVAKSVLQALNTLHQAGYTHTDVKPDNILVNLSQTTNQRFDDVQLADCGGTVRSDSIYATEGYSIGATCFRSPEATLNLPWGPATDIWSFGTVLISLIYGGNWHIFNPRNDKISPDNKYYAFTALKKHHIFFGPFPTTYTEFANDEALEILIYAMEQVPGRDRRPFELISPIEIPPADLKFLLKIMKLDPRQRPTAEELLDDEWFTEDSTDTREPPKTVTG